MIDNDFSALKPFIQELESIREEVADMWIARDKVTALLHFYKLKPQNFRDYFGIKVYDFLIQTINKESLPQDCPVIHVLLQIYKRKQIKLHHVYEICSELKNIILFHFVKRMNDTVDDLIFWKLADLIDKNFSSFIQEYVQEDVYEVMHDCKKEYKEKITPAIPQTAKESKTESNVAANHRFQDIRYSKQERYSSDSLFEMLDETVIDKIEIFLDNLNDMVLTLYDIEESNSEKSVILMQEVSATLNEFYILADSFVAFPVMVSTFKYLSLFLLEITSKMYDKKEQKQLLIMHLIGLTNDLEKWIDIVFIQKLANDVHYLDASFADNVVEIEAIFHKKEIETDDEDDLEFF